MRGRLLSSLLITSLLLASCASTTTVYYTLSAAETPASGHKEGALVPQQAYALSRVTVPAQVDDTPLIVRQSNDQLMVLTYDKWTAPLGEIMRNAISQELTNKMGMPPIQGVLATTFTANTRVNEVAIDVQRFEMQPAKQASLGVVWRVTFHGQNKRPVTCYAVFSTPATPGVAPLVLAQQRNVAELASKIAQTLSGQATPSQTTCQQA